MQVNSSREIGQIDRNGRKFMVDLTQNSHFWKKYSSGIWEPETLHVLSHRVRPDTTYLDVGAWIGPTALFAAQNCKTAHAFEPDPVAFQELKTNLALNTHIHNLCIHNLFVGVDSRPVKMGSRSQPGDSMSSALFASGANNWHATSTTLDRFAEEIQLSSPVFLKMDIEGGEYSLMPSLRGFVLEQKPTLLLSLHPAYFAMATEGQSLARKVLRRARLLRAHLRLAQVLNLFDEVRTLQGERIGLAAAIIRVGIGRRFAPDNTLVAHFLD